MPRDEAALLDIANAARLILQFKEGHDGNTFLEDADGQPHDWRTELVAQLLKVQRADGSWVNENGRWMEQIPDLVAAYSALSIEHATREWQWSPFSLVLLLLTRSAALRTHGLLQSTVTSHW